MSTSIPERLGERLHPRVVGRQVRGREDPHRQSLKERAKASWSAILLLIALTVLVAASVAAGIRPRPIRLSPRIERIEPPSAGIAGGATVTIVGANFPPSLAGVTFDGVSAVSIEVTSPTSIRAVIPPHQGGFAEVRVTTRSGDEAVTSFLREAWGHTSNVYLARPTPGVN